MAWLWYIFRQLAALWPEFVIQLVATFLGVALAVWLEHCRVTRQEKNDFGKVLQSLLMESSLNHSRLDGAKDWSVSAIPGSN